MNKPVRDPRFVRADRTSPEYHAWQAMKQRCGNPRCRQYPNYGGRGIEVCEAWANSYAAFLADMGPRPSPAHQIERRDNEGPYAPGNCCWATRTQQARNRRSNRRLTWNGETRCLAEWAGIVGVQLRTLQYRLDHWSVERALSTPVRRPCQPNS